MKEPIALLTNEAGLAGGRPLAKRSAFVNGAMTRFFFSAAVSGTAAASAAGFSTAGATSGSGAGACGTCMRWATSALNRKASGAAATEVEVEAEKIKSEVKRVTETRMVLKVGYKKGGRELEGRGLKRDYECEEWWTLTGHERPLLK